MGRINAGKVILGGLAAGVVANLLDYVVQGLLMAEESAANAQRLGLNMQHLGSSSMMITWVVIDFIYGLIIAFTYAAIRPRFGPGPKTGVIAGLIPWAAICIIFFGLASSGMFPMNSYYKQSALTLIVAIAAGLTAGKLYSE
jgi:hypothetical protein